MNTCPTCTRSATSPYRSVNPATGAIAEGCIDACHTPHVTGQDAEWHNRPAAVESRRKCAERLEAYRTSLRA